MLSASAVLCHPLLQRLTWELPELRLSLFIPGDYKLKIWVKSGGAMTSRMYKLLPAFAPGALEFRFLMPSIILMYLLFLEYQ